MQTLPGRREELRWLADRLRTEASGGAILVFGEAGVGKTRLVRDAIPADLVRARITFPGSRFAAPGLGLRRLAEAGGRAGDRLSRALAAPPEDDGPQLSAVCVAADDVVRSASPGVVILDDVQWADDLTLAWVSLAGDLLETAPATLVLVARSGARLDGRVADAVAPLRRRGMLEELELLPLDAGGVREMARAFGLPVSETSVRELYHSSDGLPLVVEELLRTRADVRGAAAPTDAPGVPGPVVAIVRETLTELTDDACWILFVAALCPQPPAEDLLRAVTAWGRTRFDRALEAALACGLLTRDGEGVTFRHDLQREAVQLEIPLAERRRIHRRIAAVLERRDHPPSDQIAQQLIEAGERERARHWLQRAADDAVATHDPGSGLSYLMAAVRLGASGPELVRVVNRATVAARGADRQEDGVRLIDAALGGRVHAEHRGRVLLARSRLVLDRGDFAGRLDALEHARRAFLEAGDDAGLAAALGSMALPVDGLLPIRERIRLGRQGLELAERSGDPMAVARCAGNLAAAELSEGHHRRAFALWSRAMAAADPGASPEAADEYLRNAGNRALASVAYGMYEPAARVIRDGLRIAADRHPRWEGKLRTTEALLLWRLGRWDEALDRAAHGHPVPETYTALVDALRAAVAFERERRADIEDLTRAAATLAEHSDHAWAAAVQAILTRIRNLRREPVPGRGILPLVDQVVIAGMRTGWEDLLPAAAEADPVTYRRVLSALGALRPAGLRVRAASALAEGLAAGSDHGLLEQAGEAFEELGEPYPAAQAYGHAALARHRDGRPAGELALRAATLFREIGADRSLSLFLRRAPRLRSLEGFRSSKGATDPRWSLSPRESEIANLARRGYTARQIGEALGISVRTVEKHLEAVKAKLGAARKSELVRLLSEEPSEPPAPAVPAR